MRNRKIIDLADDVVAYWDYKSPGTKQGIDLATMKSKLRTVYRIDETTGKITP